MRSYVAVTPFLGMYRHFIHLVWNCLSWLTVCFMLSRSLRSKGFRIWCYGAEVNLFSYDRTAALPGPHLWYVSLIHPVFVGFFCNRGIYELVEQSNYSSSVTLDYECLTNNSYFLFHWMCGFLFLAELGDVGCGSVWPQRVQCFCWGFNLLSVGVKTSAGHLPFWLSLVLYLFSIEGCFSSFVWLLMIGAL